MKRNVVIAAVTSLCLILIAFFANVALQDQQVRDHVKVGVVYIDDSSTAYTKNFQRVFDNVEHLRGDAVEIVSKYNVTPSNEKEAFQELVDEGCDLIFSTSASFGFEARIFAADHPEVQICQVAYNANETDNPPNFHTFRGRTSEARYICGVIAGMKLAQLIDEGVITPEQAKIGYVGAFTNPEVISGFTAFLLGARSVVPETTMEVLYTDSWSNYMREMSAAEELIDRGCVIISQHSDTKGAAVACENTSRGIPVFHIGYNQSMLDVAPATSLAGCRIDWKNYVNAAIDALLYDRDIETMTEGRVNGTDVSAGFDHDWVSILPLNNSEVAPGTAEKVQELIQDFKRGRIQVFQGDYTGVNALNPNDTCDLREGYVENEHSSAPSFCYILDDVITQLN